MQKAKPTKDRNAATGWAGLSAHSEELKRHAGGGKKEACAGKDVARRRKMAGSEASFADAAEVPPVEIAAGRCGGTTGARHAKLYDRARGF